MPVIPNEVRDLAHGICITQFLSVINEFTRDPLLYL